MAAVICPTDQHCCPPEHGGAQLDCCCSAVQAAAISAQCLASVQQQTAMLEQVLQAMGAMQLVLQNVENTVLTVAHHPASSAACGTRNWWHQAPSAAKKENIHTPGVERDASRKQVLGGESDVAAQDHQCTMSALEAFSANKTATINAEDFVSATRALGFEEAFVGIVGEGLSSMSVKYLLPGSDADEPITFDVFNRAMKQLSNHQSTMAAGERSMMLPGSIDFGSVEALSIVKDAEADMVSQASTNDKTSEARTPSWSMVSERQCERRPSLLSTHSLEEVSDVVRQLGGYSTTLNTRSQVLGPLECIVIEPMGRQLRNARFVTTGVVVCLHGMAPSQEVLHEWGQVLKLTRWLELGMSVVLPNVEMSAALQLEDLEGVIESTLDLMSFHRCIIAAKFWGAQRAVQLAASERLAGKVDALILVAPSSPAPADCARLEVPVLLCWARDDDTASFEEADMWIKALDERCAPSMLQDAPVGGHRFDCILAAQGAAATVRRFTVAALMLATLGHADEESECKRSQRIMRLSRDLPEFLQFNFEEAEDYDADEDIGCVDIPEGPTQRLVKLLPQWIQAGVPTDSE